MTRRALSLVIAALLLQAPVSWAVQLDKESCTKLKSEQAQLEKDGARGSLGKGPDWAKANLGPEKLDQVRRLIEVDEQLLFRCGGRPLVVLPSDPDAAPGEGAPEKPEKSQLDMSKKAAVPAKRATAPPPGKEREARPAAPPPRGSAPAVGAASEVAKEPPPAGAGPTPEAASPPPPTKQDPANVAPAATAVTPPPTPSPSTKAEEEKKAAALKAAKTKAKKKAEDAYRPPAPEWSSNPFADQVAPAKK
jgi:hypothetical protein